MNRAVGEVHKQIINRDEVEVNNLFLEVDNFLMLTESKCE